MWPIVEFVAIIVLVVGLLGLVMGPLLVHHVEDDDEGWR